MLEVRNIQKQQSSSLDIKNQLPCCTRWPHARERWAGSRNFEKVEIEKFQLKLKKSILKIRMNLEEDSEPRKRLQSRLTH